MALLLLHPVVDVEKAMNTNDEMVKAVLSNSILPEPHSWKLSIVGCIQRAPTSFKQSWKDFEFVKPAKVYNGGKINVFVLCQKSMKCDWLCELDQYKQVQLSF